MRALAFVLLVSLLPLTAAVADGPTATVLVASDGPLGVPDGFRATCTVAAGQTLAAALDDAQAAGCIPAVSWTTFSFGRFIDCIGHVCGTTGATGFDGQFWIIYENDVSASAGADDLTVDADDAFQVSYDRCPFVCAPTYIAPSLP